MVQIKAKKKQNGYVLGVDFTDGVGETESPPALAFFAQSDDYEVQGETADAGMDEPGQDDKPAGKAKPATAGTGADK